MGVADQGTDKGKALSAHSWWAGALIWVLLLAFLLRAYGLAAQSFWHDEGLSLTVAQETWAEILRGGGEYHPPLYHLLLGAWTRLAGVREFSARYLSLLCGVVTVALGAKLGSLLVGRRAGALGALLLAVSPVEVWYSQEVRMYALLGALSLASSVCLLRLLYGKGGRGLWAAYALLNIAAVYSHYYGALVLVAQAVWVLVYTARRRTWQLARAWGLAQVGLGLALVPWLPLLWQQFRAQDATYWPGRMSLLDLARATWPGFMGAGLMVPEQTALCLAWLAAGLAALGLAVGLVRTPTRSAAALLALHVLVPFALMYAIVRGRPKYSPRYLLVVVPPYLVLAGAGAAMLLPRALRRWHAWLRVGLAAVLMGALTIGSALASTNPLRDSRFGRDDMRSVAHYLTRAAGDEEAVILLSGHFLPVFRQYYNRPNCFPIPPEPMPAPDVDQVLGFEAIDDLNRALAGHRGVWLVLWQDNVVDPNGVVTGLLDGVASEVPVREQFRGLGLRHYTFTPGTQVSREMFGQQALDLTVAAGGVKLLSAGLAPARAGAKAIFFLAWQAQRPLEYDYHASWRLFDAQGREWTRIDTPLAGEVYFTQRWQPGRLVLASHALPLPADLPPGEYELRAWVYPLTQSAHAETITVGKVHVLPRGG